MRRLPFLACLLAASCAWALQANVASQKVLLYAYNKTTGAAVADDPTAWTIMVSVDGAEAGAATNVATSAAVTNQTGMHALTLSQAETNGTLVSITATTATANTLIEPLVIYTVAATPAVNVTQWNGTAIPGVDTAGYPKVTVKDGTGTGEIDTSAGLVQLLAATQASIDAIETDTGTTLEGHLTDIKGTGFAKDTHSLPQCLTATGFSTLDAAGVATAVWNAATATYGSAGSYGLLLETDLDAAISSRAASATALSNATWTDAKAGYLTAAVATATALATSDGKLDTLSTRLSAARAGYLDNLSAGAVALAATALSNATWTDAKAGYLTGAVATAAALTTVGDNVVLILADTGELQTDWHDGGRLDLLLDASGDPWSTALPGAYGAGTAGYIVGTYVDAAISGIAAVVGAGATPYTLTITTGAGAPVGEVRTWVTTDAAGTNVTAGPVSTEDDGTVTFYLDSGVTYYRWCKKGGYTFTNPKEFTVP